MMRYLTLCAALILAQARAEMEKGWGISPGVEEVYRYTGNEVQVHVAANEQEAAEPDTSLLTLLISKQGQSARLALTPTKLLREDGAVLLEGETRGLWHIFTADDAAPGVAPSGFSLRSCPDRSPEPGDAPSVRVPADSEGLSFPYEPASLGKDYVLIHSQCADALRMRLGADQFELVAKRGKISIPSARGKTYAWLAVHALCLLALILSGVYTLRRRHAWSLLSLMLAVIPGITCFSLWRGLNTDANLDARFVREWVWLKGDEAPFLRLVVDDSAPHMVYTGSSVDSMYTRFYVSSVPAGHALQPQEVKQHDSFRYIDLRFPANYPPYPSVLLNHYQVLWLH